MKFSRQEYWGGVAISYSSGSSWPSDWTPISCIFLHWQAGPLPTVPPGKAWMLHNAKQLIITRKSQEMAFIHLELKIENAFPIIQLPFSLPVAQLVKNPPAMRETWVWSLSWEDPQKKGKATHSSILAWRIPWTIQSMGLKRIEQDWVTFTFTLSVYHMPLQLDNLIPFSAPIVQGCESSYCDSIHRCSWSPRVHRFELTWCSPVQRAGLWFWLSLLWVTSHQSKVCVQQRPSCICIKENIGASLVAQWLRIRPEIQGT